MAIRIYKRTSPGRRNASVNMFTELTKKSPEKTLLAKMSKTGGRNNVGQHTNMNKGGGHKRRYRVLDWTRNFQDGKAAVVVGIEYDPNRSANIALLQYADETKGYIVAPKGLQAGQKVVASSSRVEPDVGNCMPLKFIPTGLAVHCIELEPGAGAVFCRSAGTSARLTNREGEWATLVFPSGETRQVSIECRATIGVVGNDDHNKVVLGKAGRSRHLGIRPKTRGVAKNHHEHPTGGGDGKSKHNRQPASRTGLLAKGGRTRTPGKASNKRIIRRRISKRYGVVKLK